MSLILHALSNSKNNHASSPAITHEFKQQGGGIGRSQNNEWVLADTQKYLSGQHAQIEYCDNNYILTDTSTNGVFHNHATQAIGKGHSINLQDGDTLRMGIYDISVAIATENVVSHAADNNAITDDPFSDISDEFSNSNADAMANDASIDTDDPFQDMWQDDFMASNSSEKSELPVADVIDAHFKPLSAQSSADNISNSPNPAAHAQDPVQNNDPFLHKSDKANNDWDDNWFTDSDSHSVDNKIDKPVDEAKVDTPSDDDWGHKSSPADDAWDEDWFQNNTDQDKAVLTDNNAADIDSFFTDTDRDVDKNVAIKQKETLPENESTHIASEAASSFEAKREETPLGHKNKKVKIPSPALKTTAARAVQKPSTAEIHSHSENRPENQQDDYHDAIQQFIAGLQLDDEDMEKKVRENLDFKHVGELFKSSIQGTLDILHSRTHIKNEMRMDVTTIQPIENNPLKFSITADEALIRLLVPQKNSYLAPKQSLEEAYDDIRAHQIAVISGIQATLSYMLKRFEPKKLTTRLQKKSPIAAIIPLHRQAKLWSLFEDLYETLQEEAEDDFNRLFGREFSKAYEQQIERLKEINK